MKTILKTYDLRNLLEYLTSKELFLSVEAPGGYLCLRDVNKKVIFDFDDEGRVTVYNSELFSFDDLNALIDYCWALYEHIIEIDNNVITQQSYYDRFVESLTIYDYELLSVFKENTGKYLVEYHILKRIIEGVEDFYMYKRTYFDTYYVDEYEGIYSSLESLQQHFTGKEVK